MLVSNKGHRCIFRWKLIMECEEKLFVNHEIVKTFYVVENNTGEMIIDLIVKTFYVVENNTGEMIIDLIKNLFTQGF